VLSNCNWHACSVLCPIEIRNVSIMLNPFITPALPIAELEGKRRKQFNVVVYATLIAMTVFLLGMLIQGYRAQQMSSKTLGTVISMKPPGKS